ncbi:hypothetical protein Riv7116_1844 [Rivularia sp. PCC 7116]|uniref:hypothetical protein n=1 Tax=Rivularia sp. PCC 7116 TaxID=373994 RepID=UPI00029F47A3|nr:hypothetical protein [Rivularia sp. PCC 7116]AFY54385.1 hypothetical protein Riv7116_1844 [Rivularia sp. PCC 7116]
MTINLSLQQLFGENAVSDANYLIINKNDLNLSSDANNNSEQLLAAIIKRGFDNFEGYITTETGAVITDEKNRPISYNNSNLYHSNIELWRRQLFSDRYQHIFVVEMDEL